MHFATDHDLPADPAAVVEVFCDSRFHTTLDLPDLSRPEVVREAREGSTRVLALRYRYEGQLDGIAKKLVGDRALTWVQELRVDTTSTGTSSSTVTSTSTGTSAYTGTLSYSVDGDAGRMQGEAQVSIVAVEPGRSRRHIEGDLRVRIPVVGGRAERAIVPGLVRRIDVEAAALAHALTARA